MTLVNVSNRICDTLICDRPKIVFAAVSLSSETINLYHKPLTFTVYTKWYTTHYFTLRTPFQPYLTYFALKYHVFHIIVGFLLLLLVSMWNFCRILQLYARMGDVFRFKYKVFPILGAQKSFMIISSDTGKSSTGISDSNSSSLVPKSLN